MDVSSNFVTLGLHIKNALDALAGIADVQCKDDLSEAYEYAAGAIDYLVDCEDDLGMLMSYMTGSVTLCDIMNAAASNLMNLAETMGDSPVDQDETLEWAHDLMAAAKIIKENM